MTTFRLILVASLILQYYSALFGLLLVTVFAYQYLPLVQIFYATGTFFSVVYFHANAFECSIPCIFPCLHGIVAWVLGKCFLMGVPRRWHSKNFIACDNSTPGDMKTTSIGLRDKDYHGRVIIL